VPLTTAAVSRLPQEAVSVSAYTVVVATYSKPMRSASPATSEAESVCTPFQNSRPRPAPPVASDFDIVEFESGFSACVALASPRRAAA